MVGRRKTSGPRDATTSGSRSPALGDDEVVAVAGMFRMLADVTRTRILLALVDAGELHVSAIAAVVDRPETSVSHALRLLRAAGMVKSRRAGRSIHYSVADDYVRQILVVSRRHLDLERGHRTRSMR